MSADNWARCPRCSKLDEAQIDHLSASVDKAYGTVPIEDFDRMRAELRQRRGGHASDSAFLTFREDYEFYGIEGGSVTASYRGGCSVCGLRLDFEHTETVDVDGATS